MSEGGWRRFEREEEGVRRHWLISCRGRAVELVWGALGGTPSRLIKELPSDGKAKAEAERLIRQRLGMGYVEVAAG